MNEMQEVRSLEVIGAEIRAHAITMEYHMRGTVYEAIEIGRRLVEARDVAKHGEWMAFLERETPFSHDKANNLIKVFEAYGDQQKSLFGTELSNSDTYRNLSYSQALALLALPAGERETFVETHDVESMTTSELKKAIRERDEAKAAAEYSEAKLKEVNERLEVNTDALAEMRVKSTEDKQMIGNLKERIKELESRPVDVAVQVDEEAVKRAADEARAAADAEWGEKLKAAEDKLKRAEEKAKKAAEKVKSAGEDATKETAAELEAAKAEAEKAKAEAEQLRKQLAMSDAAVTTFKVHFAAWQAAYKSMQEALASADETSGAKLRAAIAAQISAWKDGAA